MTPDEAMQDLVDRCKSANATLLDEARKAGNVNTIRRLEGKAEGVRLVLDYIRHTRGLLAESDLPAGLCRACLQPAQLGDFGCDCCPNCAHTLAPVTSASSVQTMTDPYGKDFKSSPDPARPSLLTYRGVRIDQDDHLWGLYLKAGESSAARTELYEKAGAGGWDDECRDCTRQRFSHGGSDHFFISEEQ